MAGSTTYIGQAMAREKNAEPDAEYATRMGALSMLFNSIVAVMAGALLPYLSRRDKRLLRVQDEDEEEETTRLRGLIHEWRAQAAKKGKPMKLPTLPVLYRTIWIGALIVVHSFDDDDLLYHFYSWRKHFGVLASVFERS
jgi:solute carrier family 45 protein 1/2/4